MVYLLALKGYPDMKEHRTEVFLSYIDLKTGRHEEGNFYYRRYHLKAKFFTSSVSLRSPHFCRVHFVNQTVHVVELLYNSGPLGQCRKFFTSQRVKRLRTHHSSNFKTS